MNENDAMCLEESLSTERSSAANRNVAHCGPRRGEVPDCATPRSEGSSASQLDLLAMEIAKLDKSVELLLEKIYPVMLSDEEVSGKDDSPMGVDSRIASIIQDNRMEISRISVKVRWMANHVDVIV